jgi:hypothetical protein
MASGAGAMIARSLADAVVVLHAAFVLFVPLGGLLALRWRKVAWVHLPCAVYGAAIELGGWTCPLTPLENELRRRGGEAGYPGGFIEHYLLPVIYPAPLPAAAPWVLAATVLLVNVAVYGAVLARRR